MIRVLIPGELLIESNHSTSELHYEVGGSAVAVAKALKNWGVEPVILAAVGSDASGEFLLGDLQSAQLTTQGVVALNVQTTTMTLPHKKVWRGAGAKLDKTMIAAELLTNFDVLSLNSSLALLGDDLWATYTFLLAKAIREQKPIVVSATYDEMWFDHNVTTYRNKLMQLAAHAAILRVSLNELKLVTGTSDPFKGVLFFHEIGTRLVIVILGKGKVFVSFNREHFGVAAIQWKGTHQMYVEDVFLGDFIGQALAKGLNLNHLTHDELLFLIHHASAAATLKAHKAGALTGQATLSEIDAKAGEHVSTKVN